MRNKIRYIRLIGLIFVLIVGSSLTFAQIKEKVGEEAFGGSSFYCYRRER